MPLAEDPRAARYAERYARGRVRVWTRHRAGPRFGMHELVGWLLILAAACILVAAVLAAVCP
jgi:hypothetical protein